MDRTIIPETKNNIKVLREVHNLLQREHMLRKIKKSGAGHKKEEKVQNLPTN